MKIGAVCKRENLRDAFVSKDGTKLADLPKGATVGTSSLRRRSQLLAFRPDLNVVDMRGNLNTRWRKLHESDEMAGLILAAAGLLRMGWEERITEFIDTDIMLPAVGQGAIAVEIRQGDPFMDQLTAELTDADAWRDTMCERALLRRLEGGCQVPIGAYARMDDGDFILEGMIGSLDGTRIVRDGLIGDPADPEGLGNALAERLLDKGGDEILAEVRAAEAEG